MAKPKISISPRSAYQLAPITVRIAYMLMLTSGALLLADTVAGGSVLHVFNGSGWWILLGVFLAYMSHDSGLLILRGRSIGSMMASLFGGAMLTISGLQFAGILGKNALAVEVTAVAVGLVGLGILVMVFLPASRRYAAEAQRIRMAGSRAKIDYSNVDLGEAKPGSWDAIKAVEKQSAGEQPK